jgi:hypothetical protein
MKIILKFKDGMEFTTDLGDEFRLEGDGNIFDLLRKGKENNSTIMIDDGNKRVQRRYRELRSVEIILD